MHAYLRSIGRKFVHVALKLATIAIILCGAGLYISHTTVADDFPPIRHLSNVGLVTPDVAFSDLSVSSSVSEPWQRQPSVFVGSSDQFPKTTAHEPDGIRDGDTVKVAFYEKIEDSEDRWRGRARGGDLGYHQRAELSGDFIVQDDGTMSVPILGRFDVRGKGQQAVVTDLTKAFVELTGRRGFVNIVDVERQPIFVVGLVKNPGSFKFTPGMTPLHAVALAGGLKTVETEAWQRVESGRELERLQRALDRVKTFVARTSVLRAERDGRPPDQATLSTILGSREASLVGDEVAQRKLISQSRAAQEAALTMAVENARSDLDARRERIAPLEALIKIRDERQRVVSQLVDHNTISRPVLIQSQGDLAEVQDRRQQALIEVDTAKNRLAEAERELGKMKVETVVEVSRATASAEQDAVTAIDDSEGALDVVRSLAPKDANPDGDVPATFEVVRRHGGVSTVMTLAQTDPLEPGDLVRLKPETTR